MTNSHLLIAIVFLVFIPNGLSAVLKQKDLSSDAETNSSLFTVNFIDGSGEYSNAINDTIGYMYALFFGDRSDYGYSSIRHIVAAATYEFVPWPGNVTNNSELMQARDYLNQAIKPYSGIFDLQTAVTEFLANKNYSHINESSINSTWAIFWQYSDTANGVNNLINAAEKLIRNNYSVLVITNRLTRYRYDQFTTVLQRANLYSTFTDKSYNPMNAWFQSRIRAGPEAPLINQTGSSGIIQSPGYPQTYPRYSFQEYYIEAPSGYQVLLDIKTFQVNAYYDFLDIYGGSSIDDDSFLYRWTGTISPKVILINKRSATLRFMSGYSGYQGFNISWVATIPPPKNQVKLN